MSDDDIQFELGGACVFSTISGGSTLPTIEFPTVHIRFVLRDAKRILQQEWRIEAASGVTHEWRDVPLEVE